MTHPSDTIQLERFQGFRCTSCGVCCTRKWGVVVEPSVEEGIRGSEFFSQRERQGYVPLSVISGAPIQAAKKGDGSCVFLAEENLCGLHRELGGSGKPIGCQIFPYRLVRTPTGVYASQSFACPPVVLGLDDNAEENRAELSSVLRRFPEGAASVPDEEFPVHLTQRNRVTWLSYLRLEERLLEGYNPESPLESLLGLVTEVLRLEQLASGATLEDWPNLTSSNDLFLPQALLMNYLVAVLSILECEDDLDARMAFQGRLREGEEVESCLVGGRLPAVDFVLEPTSNGPLDQAFARYVRNSLQGKLLLLPTVASRLLGLSVGYGLLRLYQEGFLHRSSGTDAQQAMILAFEVIEAEVLSHSDLMDRFFLNFEETLTEMLGE